MDEVPSSRILQKYNSRKSANDPGMPCVVIAEPCPCWTNDELAAIDGFHPDGYPLIYKNYYFATQTLHYEWSDITGSLTQPHFAILQTTRNMPACALFQRQSLMDGSQLKVNRGSHLTDEEFLACAASLEAHVVADTVQ